VSVLRRFDSGGSIAKGRSKTGIDDQRRPAEAGEYRSEILPGNGRESLSLEHE